MLFRSQKGSIAVGKDADIVIYDKDKDFTISVDTMHSDCDHTIWEGKKLRGYPVRTFLRGNVVYADGEFKGTPGMGQFVPYDTVGMYCDKLLELYKIKQ